MKKNALNTYFEAEVLPKNKHPENEAHSLFACMVIYRLAIAEGKIRGKVGNGVYKKIIGKTSKILKKKLKTGELQAVVPSLPTPCTGKQIEKAGLWRTGMMLEVENRRNFGTWIYLPNIFQEWFEGGFLKKSRDGRVRTTWRTIKIAAECQQLDKQNLLKKQSEKKSDEKTKPNMQQLLERIFRISPHPHWYKEMSARRNVSWRAVKRLLMGSRKMKIYNDESSDNSV